MVLSTPIKYAPLPNTESLESPFGWTTSIIPISDKITLLSNTKATLSFTATRIGKIVGYIPGIGTFVGIGNMLEGFREYNTFKTNNPANLKTKGVLWMIRGALEFFPLLGGLICVIIDIAVSHFQNFKPLVATYPALKTDAS
jgi:hypothetical protein